MADEILLTQEGYDKIVAEHEELVSVRRKEISEKLKEAISYGDLSENAEYDAAKNEQAELEGQDHQGRRDEQRLCRCRFPRIR